MHRLNGLSFFFTQTKGAEYSDLDLTPQPLTNRFWMYCLTYWQSGLGTEVYVLSTGMLSFCGIVICRLGMHPILHVQKPLTLHKAILLHALAVLRWLRSTGGCSGVVDFLPSSLVAAREFILLTSITKVSKSTCSVSNYFSDCLNAPFWLIW